MKRKKIEKIPWQSKGKKNVMIATAKVHKIDAENILIVDFSLDKPILRIAMSQNDFENYIPESSTCQNISKWNRRKYSNFRYQNGFNLPYKLNYNIVADKKSAEVIHQFVYGNDKYDTDWNYDIDRLQYKILRERIDKVEERRQVGIIEKMKTVPEPTEGFVKWAISCVEEHIMYMLPFHEKKATKAICSFCHYEHEYERGKIKPKQIISCPNCKSKCTVRRVDYENLNPIPGYRFTKEVLLFQKIGNEFCERHFYLEHYADFSGESTNMTEIGRIFYPTGRYSSSWTGEEKNELKDKSCTYYYKYNPWDNSTFWDDRNLSGLSHITLSAGPVYTRTINKRMFEGTRYQYCAMELIKEEKGFRPIEYLKKFDRMPQKMEMMVKTGLLRMALEISEYEFSDTGKPWEQLGITKVQMNRLKNINGGRGALAWMRYEDYGGRLIDDETIKYFEEKHINPENLDFILYKMSERKIMNYIIRQQRQLMTNSEDILILWRDYLSMATRMKMNVHQELIFKPRNVKQAHDDMVKLCGGADVAKRAGEIVQKYPDVDEILQSIKNKYEYRDEQYAVVVPERIEDIIYEGIKLGHCLDKSDIYFDRIQRRESFIFFLRKTMDVETSYYTLEVEPGGTIRQKRTTGDRQDKDFKEALSFIRKWQREVKKRLNKSDKELAARSAKLREQEFIELREKQTKIWHGQLAGKLLADVLEADLMVANG